MTNEANLLKAKLNLETAQVAWTELQRFFAKGSVIWLDDSLDLIEVALAIAADDSHTIKAWKKNGRLEQVSDDQARQWLEQDTWLWSVVVRPLILVQNIELGDSGKE